MTLAHLPSMLHEIVHDAVDRERDMSIVGECSARDDLVRRLTALRADVAIVGVEQAGRRQDIGFVEACLRALPSLRLLLIARSGREALLYELRPQKTPLGELSREGLIAAIRGQLAPGAAPPGH